MGNTTTKEEEKNPCQTLACKIQDCLAKNNHIQDKCKFEIESFNKCMQRATETEWQKEQLLKNEKKTS